MPMRIVDRSRNLHVVDDKPFIVQSLKEILQGNRNLISTIREFTNHTNRWPVLRRCDTLVNQFKRDNKTILAYLNGIEEKKFRWSDLKTVEKNFKRTAGYMSKIPNLFHFDGYKFRT